ncbi:uncharacterized protein LOC113212839 isoform X3 [Frankliniella occidentalis]|uniref:Uncharacterized protein LOC113212839 isoform X3 n=1 Tax=Frankliniella occidentalis TaxID=133901 RepID=A0A6J1T1M1_FRAOC|nr:uncharacterized protein LOC113212839 isoform X3 [Frankliniella occidentalis]
MQQHTTALAGVLFAAVITLLQPAALLAACCWPIYSTRGQTFCSDGAPSADGLMNHCGVGPCNIFHCNCDDGCRPWHPPVTIKLVERPEAVVSNKLHCHPGHGACVLEIEHIKSFTVTTGFEMSTSLDFSKVVPASVTLTKKTDWARTTGTSLKYQCQAQEGYSTWISIKPQYYKAKTLQPTGLYTRRNGETGIPVCDVADVYLPRINSHGSIAGDVHCHAEKLNL